jgi:hypothetical protein
VDEPFGSVLVWGFVAPTEMGAIRTTAVRRRHERFCRLSSSIITRERRRRWSPRSTRRLPKGILDGTSVRRCLDQKRNPEQHRYQAAKDLRPRARKSCEAGRSTPALRSFVEMCGRRLRRRDDVSPLGVGAAVRRGPLIVALNAGRCGTGSPWRARFRSWRARLCRGSRRSFSPQLTSHSRGMHRTAIPSPSLVPPMEK